MSTEPLSPTAQAVLDAFLNSHICKPNCNVAFEDDCNGIAAALRVVAMQCKRDTLIVLQIAEELERNETES